MCVPSGGGGEGDAMGLMMGAMAEGRRRGMYTGAGVDCRC
jgi:hypothetical protein